MIGGQSVLAVVVGRGGSKGLPGKNVRPLAGRPLVAWTVAAGRAAATIDRLILSSDDQAIIAAARQAGCEVPFVRPAELAGDTVSLGPVLIHALDQLAESYDWLVLLQATSPLRSGADIDACVELAHRENAPVISVTPAAKPPHWMVTLDDAGRMRPVLPVAADAQRQQLPAAFCPNGAVYVTRSAWFRDQLSFMTPETRAYVMPPERSVDIDTAWDWLVASAAFAAQGEGEA